LILKGTGGPPLEDRSYPEDYSEMESKKFDVGKFNANDTFSKYLNGEVWAVVRLYDTQISQRGEENDEVSLNDPEAFDDEDDEDDDA
jgi:hypothetical protein